MPAPAALTTSARRSLVPATPSGRFGLSASLFVLLYVALPSDPAAEALAVAVLAASALAVFVGVATYRPERHRSWWFVGTAVAVHALAIAVHGWELARGLGVERSQAIALLAAPPLLVGVWGLSARRLPTGFGDRRWAIATSTVCALIWLTIVQPTLREGSMPLRDADQAGIHALLDLIAVAVVGRRLIATRERNGALVLVTVGLVLWGDAHGVVGTQVYDGTFVAASLAAGSLLVGPLLLGVAALHPDMAVTAPVTTDPLRWYRRALRELVVASVIVLVVAGTLSAAATGTPSTLIAAGLLASGVVATAAGAAEQDVVAEQVVVAEPRTERRTTDATAPPGPVTRPAPNVAERSTVDGGELAPLVDQLEMVHLPYVDLATGEVLGVEALVRWRHPTRGLLEPAEFLGRTASAATRRKVDDWTVAQAVAAAASWLTPAWIGINVGTGRLGDRAWVDHLLATADTYGVEPRRIIVETTERSFLDERAAAFTHAQRLRDVGVHVAIDDFGREVGSLRTLVHAPVDIVKLRAGALGRSQDVRGGIDTAALEAVRGTGHRTAIIGIADRAVLRRARDLGFEIGQGFALSRPLPPDVVARRFVPAEACRAPVAVRQ